MNQPFDPAKRCPRCQQLGPQLVVAKLLSCIYCDYPDPDPRYAGEFDQAREQVAEQVHKGRCSSYEP